MRLVEATSECTLCGKQFHQIDSTEERAFSITRSALSRHQQAEHPEVVQ